MICDDTAFFDCFFCCPPQLLSYFRIFVCYFLHMRPLHTAIYVRWNIICVAKQQIAWWPSVTIAHTLLFPIRYIAFIPIKPLILRVITITVRTLCIYLIIITETLFELTKSIIVIILKCLFFHINNI